MNELIDEMIKEFEESKGGSTAFIFDDGDEYHTDTGYAMEGINAFAERLNKRLISMTNGDVIKAMFPNAKTWEVIRDDVHCAYIEFKDICEIKSFPLSWWNAPYKSESEE